MKRLLALFVFVIMPFVMIMSQAQFTVEQPFFSGSAPAAPSPTIETNALEYYWVFTDMDTNNAAVVQWVDRIQGSIWTNGDASGRPLNTSTGVWFDGVGFLTNVGVALGGGNSNTHWMVANIKWVAPAEERVVLGGYINNAFQFGSIDASGSTGDRFGWGNNPGFAFPEPYTTNIWMDTAGIWGPDYNSGGAIYTNTVVMGVTNTTMTMSPAIVWKTLGTNNHTALAKRLIGVLRELAIYTNDITIASLNTNHYYATNLYKYTP